MVDFHDVRLPVDVEKGAVGGPEFNTTIASLSSGQEKRNVNWSRSRGRWNISYGMDTKANHEEVLAFFYARNGMAYGFRFKDWTDYQIGTSSTDTPQEIAEGDDSTTDFQIVRRYTDGTYTYSRNITRPVAGTVRVFINSVEQLSGWTVDNDTGIISFSSAPTGSPLESIGVICEFDVPVRFDSDKNDMAAQREDAFSFQEINVVELRE